MATTKRAPWPERLAEAEARLAAEAAKPLPPEPEDLEDDAIAAALTGRTIVSVDLQETHTHADDLGGVVITLDDGSTVEFSGWGHDYCGLNAQRTAPT